MSLACPGADCHLDVLSCEIHCESLRHVQRVWGALRKRFHSEEEPWKIVALWDGFAQEEERRCSKILMSMDGHLPVKPWHLCAIAILFDFQLNTLGESSIALGNPLRMVVFNGKIHGFSGCRRVTPTPHHLVTRECHQESFRMPRLPVTSSDFQDIWPRW